MPSIPSKFALVNQYNLNTIPGLQVYATDPPGQAKRGLNIFALTRTNARKLSSGFFGENSFSISLYIAVGSRALLDQSLDLLYSKIQADESAIVVPMAGGVRQYTATYSSTNINKGPKGGFIDLTLVFECSDSFGYDTTYTIIRSATGLTAATVNTPYTQLGSAREQGPYIEIQYTAAPTGATSKTVTISNGTSSLTITRTWSQFDLLQVDLRAKTVKVNGTDVDFSGALFDNPLGLTTLNYSDNFTTRTFRMLAYVYNRYV